MSGTQSMTVGNKGRVVLPAELRQSRGWDEGTVLVPIETDDGVLILTRDELVRRVQRQLRAAVGDRSIVDELITERRAAARAENSE